MCNAMQHGGPDDEGVFVNGTAGVALGHRRLSIIDLSSNGHQPMTDTAKKAWITFNGEIYNYRQLKKELLALGAPFYSETDTEVILQAYLHWGTAAFAKLRGMFAFALYDIAGHATYLVRDTTGIKPLYYTTEGGKLMFASEVKAFKAAGVANTTDERWPVWLLSFGHIPEPFTTINGVLCLPKGHYLQWDSNGTYIVNSYANNITGNTIDKADIAKEGIYSHLLESVNRQLISDAPIGVFLSGGIDSSILTLLANAAKKQQLKTISIYFEEKAYDERPYQDAITSTVTGECYKHLVKQQDFETHLPQIIESMDVPTTDGINTWFISKYAHDAGLKAVLSGIGADELFGGYPSFSRMAYLNYLHKLPSALLSAAQLFSNDGYKRFVYLQHPTPAADYLFLRGLFTPADIAQVMNMDESQVNSILFNTLTFPRLESYDKLHAAWFETNIYMQNQLLRDTDVMSMSHGLEVRVPFLDEDFQAYVSRIKPSIRFDSGRPKKLLIDSFNAILPQTVWKRPKMGFSFPLQSWMGNSPAITDQGRYKNGASKKIIGKFKNGQLHWSRAFALYQIQGHV